VNSRKIIIALIAVVCTALAAYSLKDSMRTYVPAREAMERGRAVQVIGTLDKSVPIRHTEDHYTFSIVDKDGTHLAMRHRGARPANMEHADQVVARGKYSAESGMFEAEKVLVKCPSRYEKKGAVNEAKAAVMK
jgi:cytochrome c-type biogenesis protein CcmE